MPNPNLPSIVRVNEQTGVDTLDQLLNNQAISTEALVLALRRIAPAAVSGLTQRSQIFPIPAQGDRCFRLDRGWEEVYYKDYSADSNPGGAAWAGTGTWIPVSGTMPTLDVITDAVNTHNNSGGWVTKTGLTAGTIRRQTGNFGVGNGSWTFPFPGSYQISAEIGLAGSSSGTRGLRVLIDDALTSTDLARATVTGAGSIQMFTTHAFASAGQVGVLQAFQDSGGNLAMPSARLRVRFLGPE